MNAIVDWAEMERQLLHALCCARTSSGRREAMLGHLARYEWREPEHRVVFDALRGCRHCEGAALVRELPARATLLGFPDVQWETYLEHGRCGGCEAIAERLGRELAGAGQ
ncbi:MAG TPA: hypothetical protein VN661_10220 [Candidatus Acidoferrales bacterium]|nr:hypothetical protein [Candidatus Acidoferrales bacterium]